MMFAAVLAIATGAVALLPRFRKNPRAAVRAGLGIALVVAGVSHFANPTPFEQHLPGWFPAVGATVVISGLVEIALGAALILQWPGRREIGLVVAGFFVAVWPANIYVAVAGIDVDGTPGGIYPWIRLPFQILFIGLALWGTRFDDREALLT